MYTKVKRFQRQDFGGSAKSKKKRRMTTGLGSISSLSHFLSLSFFCFFFFSFKWLAYLTDSVLRDHSWKCADVVLVCV